MCTSGWFWLMVPSRFHMNGAASNRNTSIPWLASCSITPAIATNTSGFVQSRSHWNSWNVVQTHCWMSSSQVKLPGAKVGNTSSSVCSKRSGTVRSGKNM